MRIRLMDTPDQVEAFADAMRHAFDVVEESGAYANRGASRMVRKYMDLRLRADATEGAWHEVRVFLAPHPLDQVEGQFYEVTHPFECHTLPFGAVCWFDHDRRADWWPAGLGTWRIRPVEQVVGGDEDGPEIAEFLQVQSFDAATGTWHDQDENEIVIGDFVRCDECGQLSEPGAYVLFSHPDHGVYAQWCVPCDRARRSGADDADGTATTGSGVAR